MFHQIALNLIKPHTNHNEPQSILIYHHINLIFHCIKKCPYVKSQTKTTHKPQNTLNPDFNPTPSYNRAAQRNWLGAAIKTSKSPKRITFPEGWNTAREFSPIIIMRLGRTTIRINTVGGRNRTVPGNYTAVTFVRLRRGRTLSRVRRDV